MIKKLLPSSVLAVVALLAVYFLAELKLAGLDGQTGLSAVMICSILIVLEISLSLDNAVVNASVLQKMNEVWRRRFLTYGILLAVFGIRLVLPLLLVSGFSGISPSVALQVALTDSKRYQELMHVIHPSVSTFGGVFLLLVGIEYFFDHRKDHHWLHWIERPLVKLGQIKSIEILTASICLIILALNCPESLRAQVLFSGVIGTILFLTVDGINDLMEGKESGQLLKNQSAGLFLYLEVLDASFSFDGVVGAFALTHSLLLIMVGLGIGALFVRSLTLYLVDHGTLSKFEFLEHGAYWAILALGLLMLTSVVFEVPEYITGLTGAAMIGLSITSSIYKKTHSKRST